MASDINVAIPPLGSPTTAGVRANFSAAKSEIEELQNSIGYADYNDVTTQTTPISIPGTSTFVKLTNDDAGPYTRVRLPSGVTSIWNTSTNQINLSQLPIDSMVNARYDITVTTTDANQAISLSTFLAIGSPSAYESPKLTQIFKTAGTYNITVFTGSYVGSTDVQKIWPLMGYELRSKLSK